MESIKKQVDNSLNRATVMGGELTDVEFKCDEKSNRVEVVISIKNKHGAPIVMRTELKSKDNCEEIMDGIKNDYPEYLI